MPDDQLVVKVMRDNGRPATYARVQVTREGHAHEVWGWAPLCYRQVKDKFLALEEA